VNSRKGTNLLCKPTNEGGRLAAAALYDPRNVLLVTCYGVGLSTLISLAGGPVFLQSIQGRESEALLAVSIIWFGISESLRRTEAEENVMNNITKVKENVMNKVKETEKNITKEVKELKKEFNSLRIAIVVIVSGLVLMAYGKEFPSWISTVLK